MAGTLPPDELKRLVLFLVGLAVLGLLLALAFSYGVELPARHVLLHAPANAIPTPVDGQVT